MASFGVMVLIYLVIHIITSIDIKETLTTIFALFMVFGIYAFYGLVIVAVGTWSFRVIFG